MPDAVVDYDLSNGKWNIIQQQNLLQERTRVLYGTVPISRIIEKSKNMKTSNSMSNVKSEDENLWNDLSEFYACEYYDVPSYDGVAVPLTLVYSRKNKLQNQNPGLLYGHGAYGEILDKRWCSELKSLLDRGWIIAYADVRYVSVYLSRILCLKYSCCEHYLRCSFMKMVIQFFLKTLN